MKNCDFSAYCWWGYDKLARDLYCDPGINRCMFVVGAECPVLTEQSLCR